MRQLSSVFIASSIALSAVLSEPTAVSAQAYRQGMADLKGNIMLPVKFKQIRSVSDNCFRVTPVGNPTLVKPFFVNQRGERIPTPRGADLSNNPRLTPPPMVPHSKGAPVAYPRLNEVKIPGANVLSELGFGYYSFDKGGSGVCDQNGKIIFAPAADGSGYAKPLWRDRLLKETFDDNATQTFKLYDESGKFVASLPPSIEIQSDEFHDNLLAVRTKDGRLYGYVNRNGEYQIKPRFTDAEDFSEGLASVQLNDHGVFSAALIDTGGNIVVGPFENARLEHMEDGLALVTLNNELNGMVDRTGAFVIKPEFEGIGRREGYFIGKKDDQLHVFSKTGELLSKLPKGITLDDNAGEELWIFSVVGAPTNGANAAAGDRDDDEMETDDDDTLLEKPKYGIITPRGTIVLEPKYDEVGCYNGGYVCIGTRMPGTNAIKVGVRGPDDKFVIPQIYDGVSIYGDAVLLFNIIAGFDKDKWMFGQEGMGGRVELWRAFLREHNVIGMTRAQIIESLGSADAGWTERLPSNQLIYALDTSNYPRCGNSPVPLLYIELDGNDRVIGWRSVNDSDAWNRTNVVYVKQKDDWHLVPKNAAESYK